MQLETGYRFCIAPRFANGLAWDERLQVNGGVTRADTGLLPDPTWHPASDSERTLLVASELSPDAWPQHVCLFAIPEHLLAKWWELAAGQVETLPTGLDGMAPFARAVADFAQFKGVPLPQQCSFEVTATAPAGLPTTTNADGIAAPSAGPLFPSSRTVFPLSRTAELIAAKSPVVGGVNLGDERTTLLFLNLHRSRMAELLNGKRHGSQAVGVTAGDLVDLFLAHFPDYPLVRLVLDPGEGVWLPDANVIYDDDCSGKQDLDVWLILKDQVGTQKAE